MEKSKKNLKIAILGLIFAILILPCAIILSGCDDKTVYIEQPKYEINIEKSENGSLSTNKTSAYEDESIIITTTPNENYKLGSILISGVAIEKITENKYLFNMPDHNITIKATFTLKEVESEEQYDIKTISSDNGVIFADKTKAKVGEKVTILASPNNNYELSSIFSDNVTLTKEANNTYSFIMPESNVTICADFQLIEYTYSITKSPQTNNANITFSVNNAKENEIVSIFIEPAPNYIVKDVRSENNTVQNFNKLNENTYTFIMPAKDVSIIVETESFVPYTIEDIVGSYKVTNVIYEDSLFYNDSPYVTNNFIQINEDLTATIVLFDGTFASTSNNTTSNYYIFENIDFSIVGDKINATVENMPIMEIKILNENTINVNYANYIFLTFTKLSNYELQNGTYTSVEDSSNLNITDNQIVLGSYNFDKLYVFGNYIVLDTDDGSNDKFIFEFNFVNDYLTLQGYKYNYFNNEFIEINKVFINSSKQNFTIEDIVGSYKVTNVIYENSSFYNDSPYLTNNFIKINENYTATIAMHIGYMHEEVDNSYSNYYIYENLNFSIVGDKINANIEDVPISEIKILNENTIYVGYDNYIFFTFTKLSDYELQNGTYTSVEDSSNLNITDNQIVFGSYNIDKFYVFGNYIVLDINDGSNDKFIFEFEFANNYLTLYGYKYDYYNNKFEKTNKVFVNSSRPNYTIDDIVGSYDITKMINVQYDIHEIEKIDDYQVFIKINSDYTASIATILSEDSIPTNFYILNDIQFTFENNVVSLQIENLETLKNIYIANASTILFSMEYSWSSRIYIAEKLTETPIQNGTYTQNDEQFIVANDKITYKNEEYTDFVIFNNIIIINIDENNKLALFTKTTDTSVEVECYKYDKTVDTYDFTLTSYDIYNK